MEGDAFNINQLFIHLSNPFARKGLQQWPLPNLRQPRIRSTAFDEAHALHMVQNRYGTHGPDDPELRPPVPLEELLFKDLSDQTLVAIRKIVGAPCLVLDPGEDDGTENDEMDEDDDSESGSEEGSDAMEEEP